MRVKLIAERSDLMVVIGGYNSSNTTHLAAICHDKAPTYHIEDASCIDRRRGRSGFAQWGPKRSRW